MAMIRALVGVNREHSVLLTLSLTDETARNSEWDFGSQPLSLHSPGRQRNFRNSPGTQRSFRNQSIAMGNEHSCQLALSSILEALKRN